MGNLWDYRGRPNSCVELVTDDMHQSLLAGERVSVLKTAQDDGAHASAYRPSSVQCMLSNIEWLSEVLDEEAVEEIGKVWHARSDRKIGSPNSMDNYQHSRWFVFEFSNRVYQVLWYYTDFGKQNRRRHEK